jgi:hypothetical protein
MAHCDVEEFLGGPRALAPQLVDQGFAGSPRQEHLDYVSVGDVGQFVARPREASDILLESFS